MKKRRTQIVIIPLAPFTKGGTEGDKSPFIKGGLRRIVKRFDRSRLSSPSPGGREREGGGNITLT